MTTVTETELQCFVDDQLDTEGRVAVIDHLLRDRTDCARVLVDLRDREMMRLLAHKPADASMPSDRLLAQAARCEQHRGKSASWISGALSRGGLATVAAVGIAVLGTVLVLPRGVNEADAAVPGYVAEAVMAQRTATLRQAMTSQSESRHFDPADVRLATRISVPSLPDGWIIRDVQLFPSDYGPSLQMSVSTAGGKPAALFATYGRTGAPSVPTLSFVKGEYLVSWARDGNTYVLAGEMSRDLLIEAARDLSDNHIL